MFCPKHSHELALKRIGKYLKNTSSCGMVINPTRELTIDAYPDADFAGMYGHEKPTDRGSGPENVIFSNGPEIVSE